MKLRLGIFCFLSIFLVSSIASAKPVVVALAPFSNYFSWSDNKDIMSLAAKVRTDLLMNYDCIVLDRSNGISLANEKKIQQIHSLKNIKNTISPVYAADYSVLGYFKAAGVENNQTKLSCTLVISDLNKKQKYNYKSIEIPFDNKSNFDEKITSAIAEKLNLKPKNKQKETINGKLNETWAVLPIYRFDKDDWGAVALDKDLQIMLELALQNSGKISTLVEHAEIDKILNELKISVFETGLAAEIAKIVGADKIISGSVSKAAEDNSKLRIDLALIDAHTGVVVDAQTATVSADKLQSTATDLINKFLEYKVEIPHNLSTSPEALKNEAQIYVNAMNNLDDQNVDLFPVAMEYAKMIYYISGDSAKEKCDAARMLHNAILAFENYRTEEGKQMLIAMILKLLKDVKYSPETQDVHILRARTLQKKKDGFNDALNEIMYHYKHYPKAFPDFTKAVIAECYYKHGDFAKALEWAKQAPANSLANKILLDTYKKAKDHRYDKDVLDALKKIHIEYDTLSKNIKLRIELTRKLEGPEAAIKYCKTRLTNWDMPRPEIQLEMAKSYIALGDTHTAAMILAPLDDERSMERSRLSRKDDLELKKEIQELKKKYPMKYVWKDYAHCFPGLKKYKIYIQPIGNPDMDIVKQAAVLINKWTGCKVVIRPLLPLPDDPNCFYKVGGQYDGDETAKRIVRAIKIPQDAVAFSCITDKDISGEEGNFYYGTYIQNCDLYSYHRWMMYVKSKEEIAKMFARATNSILGRYAGIYGCDTPICVNANCGDALGEKNKTHSLCMFCQKKIKGLTADYIHNNYLRYQYWKPGIKKSDKKQWQDKYTAIVKKILSQKK